MTKPIGSVQDFSDAAECLKALAHPVRLRIVQLLLHGRYTVGELAEDCEIADNVASENLRLLQRCGFLVSERDGRRVYYQVAEPHLSKLMDCIQHRFLPCATPSKN
ncbi:MAG: winged helix-turn-helix transcriptional regulator [Pirellulaceae bacterium]|nr:winged helix-turn-helix transcriptional regulator [Pirellulaceae bacterium]